MEGESVNIHNILKIASNFIQEDLDITSREQWYQDYYYSLFIVFSLFLM